jgi:hypothetical protein
MIRTLALLLILAAALAVPASAQTVPPLFRHIDLGLLGRVELGTMFSQAEHIAVLEHEGLYRLRPGTFSGAAAIRVRVGPDGRVSSMHFEYSPEQEDYESFVTSASSSFGAPAVTVREGDDGGQDEVSRWEDADTVLEVVRRARAGVEDVFVNMFDRTPATDAIEP